MNSTASTALLVLLVGCGARTMLDNSNQRDASEPDVLMQDAALKDQEGSDGGSICNPIPNPSNPFTQFVCTTENQSGCQAWAQSLTTSGYAHATCGPMKPCMMGDNCYNDNTGHLTCTCGSMWSCQEDEVCVSDTPDGPGSCRKMCVTICPLGCTASSCLCQSAPDDVCAASGRFCNAVKGPSGAQCESQCP